MVNQRRLDVLAVGPVWSSPSVQVHGWAQVSFPRWWEFGLSRCLFSPRNLERPAAIICFWTADASSTPVTPAAPPPTSPKTHHPCPPTGVGATCAGTTCDSCRLFPTAFPRREQVNILMFGLYSGEAGSPRGAPEGTQLADSGSVPRTLPATLCSSRDSAWCQAHVWFRPSWLSPQPLGIVLCFSCNMSWCSI